MYAHENVCSCPPSFTLVKLSFLLARLLACLLLDAFFLQQAVIHWLLFPASFHLHRAFYTRGQTIFGSLVRAILVFSKPPSYPTQAPCNRRRRSGCEGGSADDSESNPSSRETCPDCAKAPNERMRRSVSPSVLHGNGFRFELTSSLPAIYFPFFLSFCVHLHMACREWAKNVGVVVARLVHVRTHARRRRGWTLTALNGRKRLISIQSMYSLNSLTRDGWNMVGGVNRAHLFPCLVPKFEMNEFPRKNNRPHGFNVVAAAAEVRRRRRQYALLAWTFCKGQFSSSRT